MDSAGVITCVNNPDERSSQHSSDALSSIGGGNNTHGEESSGCDSDADISWSSEVELSYQQNCYKSSSLLLHQQRDDKSDTASLGDTRNGDPETALSLCNSDKSDDSNDDSDEEFTVHACLRGLIKSKSISSIQKHDYPDEEILDSNAFINASNGKCLTARLINAQAVSDEETSASSAACFLRDRAYHDHQAPIFKVTLIIK
uniref:Uncharacterized protein n=1 Tax=Elaeophora elaphi TaxID=1147741 RepID=A0A0R3S734_9BILA